jgi:hypothetical protein
MAAKKAKTKGLRRGKKLEAQKTLGKPSGPMVFLKVDLKDAHISGVEPNTSS